MGVVRKALVRQADGYVDNVILVEAAGNYQPPDGHQLIDADTAHVGPGGWHINGVFVSSRMSVSASPNPSALDATVTVRATLPAGSPDTSVTFQLEGGQAYQEPVTAGQASHNYAFALAGVYRVSVSSAHHGQQTVEETVQ